MTYAEKLKDPRWQKKRLRILERDEWACSLCGNDKDTLHVHHKKYGNESPWEEKDEDLITVCEGCHEEESIKDFFEKCNNLGITFELRTQIALTFPINTDADRLYLEKQHERLAYFVAKNRSKVTKIARSVGIPEVNEF